MTDQQRRLQGCFDVFHSAMVLLREECKDNSEAMVIVDDLEFHLLTRIRTLRHRMYVPYEHYEVAASPQG